MTSKGFLKLPNFLNILNFTSLDKLLFLSELPFYYAYFLNFNKSNLKNKLSLDNLFLRVDLFINILNDLIAKFNLKINLRLIKVFLRKTLIEPKEGLFFIFNYEIKNLNQKIKNLNKKINKFNKFINFFNDFIFFINFDAIDTNFCLYFVNSIIFEILDELDFIFFSEFFYELHYYII